MSGIANEECDGRDQDCDGAIDEGCPCFVSESRTCGGFTNAPCKTGIQSCNDNGVWSGCEGAISPTRDVCGDGIDNDCDGVIDFGCTCVPTPEQCRDGIDNDCDGVVDEPACRPDWPCTDCGRCVEGDELTDFERTLIELAPQTWFEAPNSHMREVCAPEELGVGAVSGCAAVVTAWSGGAYDSIRRRMLLWGGGGSRDYFGNEIYSFDLRSGTWSRLTEPSVAPAGASPVDYFANEPLSDGLPRPRSTFDSVAIRTSDLVKE